MATQTSSLATAGAPVKMNYAGATTLHVHIDASAQTLSDQVLLAKLPNRALVTALRGVFGSSNTASVIKLGWKGQVGASSEAAFGTHTAAEGNFALVTDNIGGVLISFTDSIGNNFAYVFATCSVGSFSDTWSLDLTIDYTVDHNEGVA